MERGRLSAGAGGRVAWGLQSLEVALGGTLTQGSPSKVGGPSVAGRDLIQGGNLNLPKIDFIFPEIVFNYCLESRRHFLTETYVVEVRLEG